MLRAGAHHCGWAIGRLVPFLTLLGQGGWVEQWGSFLHDSPAKYSYGHRVLYQGRGGQRDLQAQSVPASCIGHALGLAGA